MNKLSHDNVSFMVSGRRFYHWNEAVMFCLSLEEGKVECWADSREGAVWLSKGAGDMVWDTIVRNGRISGLIESVYIKVMPVVLE